MLVAGGLAANYYPMIKQIFRDNLTHIMLTSLSSTIDWTLSLHSLTRSLAGILGSSKQSLLMTSAQWVRDVDSFLIVCSTRSIIWKNNGLFPMNASRRQPFQLHFEPNFIRILVYVWAESATKTKGLPWLCFLKTLKWYPVFPWVCNLVSLDHRCSRSAVVRTGGSEDKA